MQQDSKIVIIGAGVFGLATAYELALQGYGNITMLDRNIPPVPDGSSVDISRVTRFDYADEEYLRIAFAAYKKWSTDPKYRDVFAPSPCIIACGASTGRPYFKQAQAALTKMQLPWSNLDVASAKSMFPTLTGALVGPDFYGYLNQQAGWVQADKAIKQLRDDCLELGVSFICGRRGYVVGFDTDSGGSIKSVRTIDHSVIDGELFILSVGSWISSLVPTYNSTLSTGQVFGYLRLTEAEKRKYQGLPIYVNLSTGWFNFPPHPETSLLKVAIHGSGYTRTISDEESQIMETKTTFSSPPLRIARERSNFVPPDGEIRLREGLRELLPELGDRPFDRAAICSYTDTPSGDFILDFHPDYKNLFIAGGGSGHGFKFLPVIGEYVVLALKTELPPALVAKWKFRKEYQHQNNAFEGDGSWGGLGRRELY